MSLPAPRFTSAMPNLPVSDLDEAIGFYVDVLGFALSFRNGRGFAIVARDAVELGLAPAAFHGIPAGHGRAYLKLVGIDALHADFAAKGVPMPHPLKVEEYEMKEFMIADPDGNLLNFGEPV